MAPHRTWAIALASGYVPGLDAAITGIVRAAAVLGDDVVGIRGGFDGLVCPDAHPGGGLVPLTRETAEGMPGGVSAWLGTGARTDPFHVRTIDEEGGVIEVDRSGELLAAARAQAIDAVLVVSDRSRLGVVWKLHRAGLPIVCIPESVENDFAATHLSFGFNSALSFAAEMIERAALAARGASKIAVVEVPGEHAGWLALQAGTAAGADAVLLPEIPYDLKGVATALRSHVKAGRPHGLVVVAQGATPAGGHGGRADSTAHGLRRSLSPGATGPEGPHVIDHSGRAARSVASELQRLTNHETYPLVLGPLVKGGPPTVVDRQLGLAYGAGAVKAAADGRTGVLVAFNPPDLTFVPLADVLNKVRTVPPASVFVETARALGIAFGDRDSEARA